MGYYFRVSGRLNLDPPIIFNNAQKAESFSARDWIETLEPVITKVGETYLCSAFEPHGELSKLSRFDSQIESFRKKYPDHKFKGVLLIEGEEQGDVYRQFFDGDVTFTHEPEIIWPPYPSEFEGFIE